MYRILCFRRGMERSEGKCSAGTIPTIHPMAICSQKEPSDGLQTLRNKKSSLLQESFSNDGASKFIYRIVTSGTLE